MFIMDQFYRNISKSIVKITIGDFFFHGCVVERDMVGLTVMASAASFPLPLKHYEILLVLPDGTKVYPAISSVKIREGVAVIPCHLASDEIDTNLVDALELCQEPVTKSEEVYTYSAYNDGTESAITKGYVIAIRGNTFFHNCSAGSTSHLGALVVNKSGQLVGLCTKFDRHLVARVVSAVT